MAGLQKILHFCINETLVLTTNLWPEQDIGLSNGDPLELSM
jgi:hypothetical protein